ncbi:TlpA family protein disulfide reductase [Sporosarcina sp. BI001-red]|uniref:TlpA family protein disulfide reductase n=1 Tax=Sporosarcina sp. BI001-red TaxID=2282866 RepID=UPI000E27422F|nr:redoxin domain-containing protein [Sporosarcina sp. BI001-red]REB11180.1 TlpA family protein disulfide reductase [Sporosarcina sp. BI001-red]
MNKKWIGYAIAILLIGTMIVMMVKSNLDKPEVIDTANTEAMSKKTAGSGLEQGDTPPDLELETLTGDKVRLSDLKGKKVILNFWATWCPPCKAEMPHMENFYKKLKPEDNVELVSVNLTTAENRGQKAVEEFADAYELTFPILLDTEDLGMTDYKVFSIPTTYILRTDGTIDNQIVGPMDEKMMEQLVKDVE